MNTVQSQGSQAVASNLGETLRHAREARGLSVTDVASQLNLTMQRVNQIESGDFEKMPGSTFARGYVRAYAKLLGLDQDRLALEFDQLTGSDTQGAAVHSLGRIEEPVRYSQSVLRWVSFLLLLALVVGGFLWWQERGRPMPQGVGALSLEHVEVDGADGTTQIHLLAEPEDQAVLAAQGEGVELPLLLSDEATAQGDDAAVAVESLTETPAGVVAAEVVVTPSAVTPEVSVAAAPVTQAVVAIAPSVTAPAPAPAPAPVAAVVAVTPSANAAAPTVAPAATSASGLQLRFTADCWTQVKDADGKILLSGLKRAGDQVEVSGKAPLELRLGFARGAQVTFNGNPVDVAPFTSGETARLQLGQ